MGTAYDSPVESTLTSMATWLTAGLPGYLTGITTKMADSLTLEAFAVIELSDGDPFSQTQYPVLLITPDTVEVNQLSSGWHELKIGADLVIAISAGSPQNMMKKVLRYVEAVRELVRDDPTMIVSGDPVVSEIRVTGQQYFPSAPEEKLLVAVVRVEIVKDVADAA